MRLISQDGMIDVPYEQASIEVNGRDIYCGYSSIITRHCTGRRFAEYSSKSKALKAMEMLREKYAKLVIFKSVYQKGLLTELNKELGFDEMQNSLTSIFKFPADSEVEV